jgi:hypothetical protein
MFQDSRNKLVSQLLTYLYIYILLITSSCHFHFVRCEIYTAVTVKNAVFLDVTTYGSCKNDVSEEHSASIIRVPIIGLLGTMLAVTSN